MLFCTCGKCLVSNTKRKPLTAYCLRSLYKVWSEIKAHTGIGSKERTLYQSVV